MNLALYARVSTVDQRSGPQLERLHEYAQRREAQAVEYLDHGVSGARVARPALGRLLEAARRREVDAVVVTRLDRLARSVRQLCDLAAELEAVGVDLVVLDQSIDTSTPSGRFLFHTLGAVAELERELIRERVVAGVAAARRRGSRLGRPRALDAQGVARARRMRRAGQSLAHVARVLGVGRETVRKALATSGAGTSSPPRRG